MAVREQNRRYVLPLIALVILVGAWQIYKGTTGAQVQSIPSPGQFFVQGVALVGSAPFYQELYHTLVVSLVGWVIAGVIGVSLGIALGLSRRLQQITRTSIDFLRTIPSITFIPVALMLFGFSPTTELVIGVYVAMWPVLINTLDGVQATPPQLQEVVRTLRIGRPRAIVSIRIAGAVPSICIGLRLGLSLSIALVVVAEMLGNPSGLGYALMYAQQSFQPAAVFFYVFAIGVLGWLLNILLVFLSVRAFPGHKGSL